MDNDELTAASEEQVNKSPVWDGTTKAIVLILSVVVLVLSAYLFRIVWIPLIIGAVTAYVLYPLVRLVRIQLKISHSNATILVYLGLIAVLIPILSFGLPVLFDQITNAQERIVVLVSDLDPEQLPTEFEIFSFEIVVEDLIEQTASAVSNTVTLLATSSVGIVLNLAQTVLLAVFTIVIGFYFTRDAGKFINALIGLAPEAYRRDFTQLLSRINGVWTAFIRGQIILSIVVALITGTIAAILGLPNPALIGLWGGLLEFLPSIGNIIWGATVIITAAIEGSTNFDLPRVTFIIIVIIVYVAFAQLDINVLIPNIIGGQVQLHPMLIILGVIVGANVGGILGVALAAPTIATIREVGRYIYAKLFDLDPFPVALEDGASNPPKLEAAIAAS